MAFKQAEKHITGVRGCLVKLQNTTHLSLCVLHWLVLLSSRDGKCNRMMMMVNYIIPDMCYAKIPELMLLATSLPADIDGHSVSLDIILNSVALLLRKPSRFGESVCQWDYEGVDS